MYVIVSWGLRQRGVNFFTVSHVTSERSQVRQEENSQFSWWTNKRTNTEYLIEKLLFRTVQVVFVQQKNTELSLAGTYLHVWNMQWVCTVVTQFVFYLLLPSSVHQNSPVLSLFSFILLLWNQIFTCLHHQIHWAAQNDSSYKITSMHKDNDLQYAFILHQWYVFFFNI